MSNTIGYKSRIITQKVKAAAPLVAIAAASPGAATGSSVKGTVAFFKALAELLAKNIWYMDVLDGDPTMGDVKSILLGSAPILRSGNPEIVPDNVVKFKFNLISGSLNNQGEATNNIFLALRVGDSNSAGDIWFTVDTGSNVLKLDTGESQIITWELSFQSGTNVSSSANS